MKAMASFTWAIRHSRRLAITAFAAGLALVAWSGTGEAVPPTNGYGGSFATVSPVERAKTQCTIVNGDRVCVTKSSKNKNKNKHHHDDDDQPQSAGNSGNGGTNQFSGNNQGSKPSQITKLKTACNVIKAGEGGTISCEGTQTECEKLASGDTLCCCVQTSTGSGGGVGQ